MCCEFDWIIMMSNYSEAVHSQVFVVVVAIFFLYVQGEIN